MADTTKITDASLARIIKQLNDFLDAIQHASGRSSIQLFDAGAGKGPGDVADSYTKLMPGAGGLLYATNLQQAFQAFCHSLEGELKQLESSMSLLSDRLQNAGALLHNASDEALTAAQMMTLIDKVYNTLGGGDPSSTSTSSTSTSSSGQ